MRSALLTLLVAVPSLAGEAEVAAKMNELQLRRDDPQARKEMEKVIADGFQAFPDSYEIAWRAARYECWVGETAATDAEKQAAAKLAWDWGDRAMKLRPDKAEANYYAAAGVGLYGQAMGVMTAIRSGVASKFNERLDKAMQIDPAVERGGPFIARGRYYYEVPFFMRDLKKSAEFLSKALAAHPENLRARLYLAQTLLKDGDAKRAKTELDRVLAGDEAYDPPDARLVKQRAKPVAKEIADALK